MRKGLKLELAANEKENLVTPIILNHPVNVQKDYSIRELEKVQDIKEGIYFILIFILV